MNIKTKEILALEVIDKKVLHDDSKMMIKKLVNLILDTHDQKKNKVKIRSILAVDCVNNTKKDFICLEKNRIFHPKIIRLETKKS